LASLLGGVALTIGAHANGDSFATATDHSGKVASGAIIFFYVGEGALWGYAARIGAGTGMSSEAISNTLAYAFFASLFGPLLAHLWKDRYGRIPPIIASIVILCAVALVLGFSREPVHFVVATVV